METPAQKGVVQVDVNFFSLEARVLGVDHFMFRSVCNIDPKMPYIPQQLIHFFVKHVAGYVYDRVLKICHDIHRTPW